MLVILSKYSPSISRATATKMNRDESNHGVIQGETLSNKARRCNQVDSFGYSDVEK